MTQKILQLLGFKQKKHSISEFLTSSSLKEKQAFLGNIIEGVNEDQRRIIDKAKHKNPSKF